MFYEMLIKAVSPAGGSSSLRLHTETVEVTHLKIVHWQISFPSSPAMVSWIIILMPLWSNSCRNYTLVLFFK